MAFTCRMNQAFSLLRSHPYGNIFDGAAKARHGVPLKMGENQIAVIFREMRSYEIFRKPCAALCRKADRSILIQYHKISNLRKAMVLRHLIMHSCAGPLAAIGRIIFHNRSIHLMHQICYQRRVQIIAGRRFSSRKLDCNILSGKPLSQRMIDLRHSLRTDVGSKVHH